MKKLLLAIFLLALSLSACTQKPGSPDYLLVKKGFKIFKLGDLIEKYDNVRLLDGYKFDDLKVYEVIKNSSNSSLFKVGKSIDLDSIHLGVYKGRIVYIKVFFEQSYREDFLGSLQAAYGDGVHEQISEVETYTWRTSKKKNGIELFYKSRAEMGSTYALAMFQLLNFDEKNL